MTPETINHHSDGITPYNIRKLAKQLENGWFEPNYVTKAVEHLNRYADSLERMTAQPQPEQPTLRDQFAMAALTGLLADSENCSPAEKNAEYAYRAADAMLAARKGVQP